MLQKILRFLNLDKSSKKSGVNLQLEVNIRRSRVQYLFTSLFALFGLVAIIYSELSDKSSFSILTVVFLILFSIFVYFSVRGLFDRTIIIKISPRSITFSDGSVFKWGEIKNIFIDIKYINMSRIKTERFYLNIELSSLGQIQDSSTRSFEIGGLEYLPHEILNIAKLYKQQATQK